MTGRKRRLRVAHVKGAQCGENTQQEFEEKMVELASVMRRKGAKVERGGC